MPKIGLIDVPDTLWEALVDRSARDFTQMAFDLARKKGESGFTDVPDQPGLKTSEAMIPHMQNCVVALVRMQTGDFLSDDKVLRKSDDFNRIWGAAQLQGDRIAYETIASDKQLEALKALVECNWIDMNTDLPPPF